MDAAKNHISRARIHAGLRDIRVLKAFSHITALTDVNHTSRTPAALTADAVSPTKGASYPPHGDTHLSHSTLRADTKTLVGSALDAAGLVRSGGVYPSTRGRLERSVGTVRGRNAVPSVHVAVGWRPDARRSLGVSVQPEGAALPCLFGVEA